MFRKKKKPRIHRNWQERAAELLKRHENKLDWSWTGAWPLLATGEELEQLLGHWPDTWTLPPLSLCRPKPAREDRHGTPLKGEGHGKETKDKKTY